MSPSLSRLFDVGSSTIGRSIEFAIFCHDIGKLSQPWQNYINKTDSERKFGPPHATLGAAFLLTSEDDTADDLNNASAIAILMHHTDSGLAQGNLERPAEDAINRGIVEYGTDNIRWVQGAEEALAQTYKYLVHSDGMLMPITGVTLTSLEKMAQQLRLWSRCPNELERHQHRLQALAIHQVLKVCDWRAASQRPSLETDEEGETVEKEKRDWQQSILSTYLDGGLLP